MSNRFSDCTVVVAAVVAVAWLTSPPAAGQAPPGPAGGCPGESAQFHPCALAKAKRFSRHVLRRQAGHARVLAWSRAQRD